VPADAVDELAAHHGVRSHRYTPRAFAMYSPARTMTVYDPARAHEVAEEVREEHVGDPEADGTREVPRL